LPLFVDGVKIGLSLREEITLRFSEIRMWGRYLGL